MALQALPGGRNSWWRARTRLAKFTLCATAIWLLLWPLQNIEKYSLGDIAGILRFFIFIVAFVCAFILAVRWFRRQFLWRLRNRLVATYALVGVAPFALLSILFGLIAYVLAGQFAIFAASKELDQQVAEMATEASEINLHLLHMDAAGWKVQPLVIPEAQLGSSAPANRTLNIYRNGQLVPVGAGMPPADEQITGAPAWIKSSFSGIVRDHGTIYARAVSTRTENGSTVTVISSEPLTGDLLARAAEGLGRVTITNTPVHTDEKKQSEDEKNAGPKEGVGFDYNTNSGAKVHVQTKVQSLQNEDLRRVSIAGGTLTPRTHWFDINVTFFTPLTLRDWPNGDDLTLPLSVSSRPSLLYHRLFTSSVSLGVIVRYTLITVAILFALIELVALIMAASLNRTITRSVASLYEGTVRVDSGDLTHRIPVTSRDQLGALSQSFNTMTASMVRLLQEQKEKERLQNELNIAQEVQANLFPRGDIRLSSLEVHGYSRPARTVGGDYYDFLLFGAQSLGLALGDISGKGISAALLMATLHSAVRAYRFAAEEIADAELLQMALRNPVGAASDEECADLFESPGKILSLLNRHLYRSTQPEKYATLWLGFYDGLRGTLTYSNGGQLPPLVLCANGEVKRLDRGGTVVGLMDDMTYQEGTVEMSPGDILVAYSDGVTEPENDFGDFGEDRLVELVRQHSGAPLKDIADHVMQALTDWIGGQEQPDDITLVLARQL